MSPTCEVNAIEVRVPPNETGRVTVRVQRAVDGEAEAPDDPAKDIARRTMPGMFVHGDGSVRLPLPSHTAPGDVAVLVEVDES